MIQRISRIIEILCRVGTSSSRVMLECLTAVDAPLFPRGLPRAGLGIQMNDVRRFLRLELSSKVLRNRVEYLFMVLGLS